MAEALEEYLCLSVGDASAVTVLSGVGERGPHPGRLVKENENNKIKTKTFFHKTPLNVSFVIWLYSSGVSSAKEASMSMTIAMDSNILPPPSSGQK